MEYVPVVMRRENLATIPEHPFPPGYHARLYQPGDESAWADVEHRAGEFDSAAAAESHFATEFGDQAEALGDRCLFLVSPEGEVVGTATAWWSDDMRGQSLGRLHWVAIVPEHQGKGLSKPLVTAALTILARYHERAYLTTQTTSAIAVKVYLDLGFAPWITEDAQLRGWRLLADALGHPALADYSAR